VLFEDTLNYFEQADSPLSVGTISITDQTTVELDETNKNVFFVTPSKGARKYILEASSRNLRKVWVKAIDDILAIQETNGKDEEDNGIAILDPFNDRANSYRSYVDSELLKQKEKAKESSRAVQINRALEDLGVV